MSPAENLAGDRSVEIAVDAGRCLAYGTCVAIHPEVFALPKGARVVELLRDHGDTSELDELDEAARSCPARAIAIRGAADA